MAIVFIIIFGLVVGSFLNVLILRLPNKESVIRGRSHCPSCKHTLGFFDLFPILSFLFLGGKCRYCRKKISIQYPLVEAATAALFLIAYFVFIPKGGATNYFLFFLKLARVWFFISAMIIIFVYDFKKYLILDRVIYPSIIVALLTIPLFLDGRLDKNIFWGIFLAAVLGGGFFLLQYAVSRGKWVGGGDVKMGVLMGLILGLNGLLVALFAYIIGAIFSLWFIASKKKTIKDALPFGPFLAGGTIISLFWAEPIIKLFFSL